MRRAGLMLACALPGPSWAAVAPPAWSFPGAELLIGAGSVVVLVVLGRALAAPALRRTSRDGADRRGGGDAR